ncbi:DUF4157 domain-containing protein [Leptolyngbya sp. 15MV]|nr:DUF4157 domain-containing protein [Leptolyngbya sp. 15MV]
MSAIRKTGAMRVVGRLVIVTCLLLAAAALALEISGHSIEALVRTHNLQAEAREIGRRSDEQLRRSTNLAARQLGGAALARTIRASRARALAEPTRAVPDDIRRELEPHFPSLDFDALRWKPATGRLSLGTVLTRWYMAEGAVVLDDVIVFTAARTARDRRLWAHELTHVLQYRELGIDGFARAYVLGYTQLENQAERNAQRVMAELRRDRRERTEGWSG